MGKDHTFWVSLWQLVLSGAQVASEKWEGVVTMLWPETNSGFFLLKSNSHPYTGYHGCVIALPFSDRPSMEVLGAPLGWWWLLKHLFLPDGLEAALASRRRNLTTTKQKKDVNNKISMFSFTQVWQSLGKQTARGAVRVVLPRVSSHVFRCRYMYVYSLRNSRNKQRFRCSASLSTRHNFVHPLSIKVQSTGINLPVYFCSLNILQEKNPTHTQ